MTSACTNWAQVAAAITVPMSIAATLIEIIWAIAWSEKR